MSNQPNQYAKRTRTQLAEKRRAAARARRDARCYATWWICTDFRANGGQRVMGPFINRGQALSVRYYVEKVEKRTYAVDEWLSDD